jgi:hypothetical protein
MRRSRIVWWVWAAVLVCAGSMLAPVSVARAAPATWSVSLDGVLGSQPLQVGFQATLDEPNGSAVVTVGGVPVTVTRSATQFFWAVDTALSSGGCAVTLTLSAPGTIGSGGGTASGPVTGTARVGCPPNPSSPSDLPISGTFLAQKLTGPNDASIQSVSGAVLVETPRLLRTASPGLVVTPGTLIRTASDGTATLLFLDGSRLTVQPNTLVTIVPPTATATDEIILSQITGLLTHAVGGSSGGRADKYRVQTAIWTIRPTGTVFSTRYGEADTRADLDVAVQTGIVDVVNRRAEINTVFAGAQQSFTDIVPRSTLMIPANRGSVVGGVRNTFMWTAFPAAAGYLFEFTLNPAFVQANASAPEQPARTVRIRSGEFIQSGGVVEVPILVPGDLGPRGTRAQWRVFPADSAGQVLAGTTSSDAYTVTID